MNKSVGQLIAGKKEEIKETYFLDGREIEEKPFKTMYQSVIGILFDAEYTPPLADKPEVRLTYNLNVGNVRIYNVNFVPYNVDFYALFINGKSRFLVNRQQIANMLSDLDALLKGEL